MVVSFDDAGGNVLRGHEGIVSVCGEDAGELEVGGAVGEIEEESDAIAEEADSPTEVEISLREDFGTDADVADDFILGGIVEGAVILVDLFCDGVWVSSWVGRKAWREMQRWSGRPKMEREAALVTQTWVMASRRRSP